LDAQSRPAKGPAGDGCSQAPPKPAHPWSSSLHKLRCYLCSVGVGSPPRRRLSPWAGTPQHREKCPFHCSFLRNAVYSADECSIKKALQPSGVEALPETGNADGRVRSSSALSLHRQPQQSPAASRPCRCTCVRYTCVSSCFLHFKRGNPVFQCVAEENKWSPEWILCGDRLGQIRKCPAEPPLCPAQLPTGCSHPALGFLGGRGHSGRCPGIKSCPDKYFISACQLDCTELPRNRAAPQRAAQACKVAAAQSKPCAATKHRKYFSVKLES